MNPAPPQPIPYQGSKRRLAGAILAFFPARVERLVEPFAGSAALSVAAASRDPGLRVLLGDSLTPLCGIWSLILDHPEALSQAYAAHWRAGEEDPDGHFARVREAFNRAQEPAALLYLLARCVKGSVRWNRAGRFNQAPDRRRLGALPERMAARIARAHALLRGRCEVRAGDYAALVREAREGDLVYLDPPWLGVSGVRDGRYHQGLDLDRFVAELHGANARGLRYLVSLDGRLGTRRYAAPLPAALRLRRVELPAGRSSQATLLGRDERTWESLYLSPALSRALEAPGPSWWFEGAPG